MPSAALHRSVCEWSRWKPPLWLSALADERLPPQGDRGSYRSVKPVLSANQRISRIERQVFEVREDLADLVATFLSRGR